MNAPDTRKSAPRTPWPRSSKPYVAKELQLWARPSRLMITGRCSGCAAWSSSTVRRPQYFGCLTNDIVYKRLAPRAGGTEARPGAIQNGRPRHKLFQRLTTNVGYPKLREHLGSVVTLMKLSLKSDWTDFQHKLDRIHPRIGDTMVLPFDTSDDSGNGL